MPCLVAIPDDFAEQVLRAIQPTIDAIKSVAEGIPEIIRDEATKQNQDVDGNQMPAKQPRPRKAPTNHPNEPLIQSDQPDLMNPSRWAIEQTGPLEVKVVYSPPDHLRYLIDKDPDHGGRKWITEDKLNAAAVTKIQEEARKRAEAH